VRIRGRSAQSERDDRAQRDDVVQLLTIGQPGDSGVVGVFGVVVVVGVMVVVGVVVVVGAIVVIGAVVVVVVEAGGGRGRAARRCGVRRRDGIGARRRTRATAAGGERVPARSSWERDAVARGPDSRVRSPVQGRSVTMNRR
jgi:hypothetical protein